MESREAWVKKRNISPEELALARQVLEEIRSGAEPRAALRAHPLPGGAGFLAKHALVAAYRDMVASGELHEDPHLLAAIRMKPVRTLSGVTTITVLTRPSPCPGECIFCPSETDMPQSYLPDEPGARRGVENHFDPWLQVSSRLQALREVGHPTDKVELLILGGSWGAYPRSYREWFVRRCFEALNEENPQDDIGDVSLAEVQERNSHGRHRNVGLVIETRPDLINRKIESWAELLNPEFKGKASILDISSIGIMDAAMVCEAMGEITYGDKGNMTRAEIDKTVAEARTRVFESMDADKNGQVSRQEWDSHHAGMKAKWKERRETASADGKDRGAWMKGGRDGRKGHRMMHRGGHDGFGGFGGGFGAKWIESADANKDGRVTLAEAKAKPLARFDAAETNKDGTLSPEERKAAREAMRAERRAERGDS